MAIFTEVTENERIIDRHLRGIHPPRLWRFWKSIYDLDLIWFDWNRPISTIWRYGHPKLTHAAARFLCGSWATCFNSREGLMVLWTCPQGLAGIISVMCYTLLLSVWCGRLCSDCVRTLVLLLHANKPCDCSVGLPLQWSAWCSRWSCC